MQINSIANTASTGIASAASEKKTNSANFGDILNDAINNAQETEAADEAGTLALLTGEDNGIHTTMIESQKAELALSLAIQIRNKVIDAYNEVMRMQL
jgi:flagellar hook-basal body complex protein FliE